MLEKLLEENFCMVLSNLTLNSCLCNSLEQKHIYIVREITREFPRKSPFHCAVYACTHVHILMYTENFNVVSCIYNRFVYSYFNIIRPQWVQMQAYMSVSADIAI